MVGTLLQEGPSRGRTWEARRRALELQLHRGRWQPQHTGPQKMASSFSQGPRLFLSANAQDHIQCRAQSFLNCDVHSTNQDPGLLLSVGCVPLAVICCQGITEKG